MPAADLDIIWQKSVVARNTRVFVVVCCCCSCSCCTQYYYYYYYCPLQDGECGPHNVSWDVVQSVNVCVYVWVTWTSCLSRLVVLMTNISVLAAVALSSVATVVM